MDLQTSIRIQGTPDSVAPNGHCLAKHMHFMITHSFLLSVRVFCCVFINALAYSTRSFRVPRAVRYGCPSTRSVVCLCSQSFMAYFTRSYVSLAPTATALSPRQTTFTGLAPVLDAAPALESYRTLVAHWPRSPPSPLCGFVCPVFKVYLPSFPYFKLLGDNLGQSR